MPLDQIANFVRGSTDASVNSTQTTISVQDASIFPDPANGKYNLVLWDDGSHPRPDQDPDVEIVRVTGRDTTNNDLTVSRGQEGTSGVSHPSGSALQLSPTAAVFGDIAATDQPVEDFPTDDTTQGNVLKTQGDGSTTFGDAPAPNFDDIPGRKLSFQKSKDLSTNTSNTAGIIFNNTGSKLFVSDNSDVNIYSYSLSTAFDVTTATFDQSFDISPQASNPINISQNDDGSKMYITDFSNQDIYSYTLTTPYDISTASFNQSFDVSGQDGTPVGIAWSGTGDKLFVCGQDNNTVFEYKLSSDFDLSTASFTSNTLDVSTEVDFTTDIAWKNDGVEFYTIDLSNIFQYGTDFFGW